MFGDGADYQIPTQGLRELLLDYVQASKVQTWPGGDGLTIDDVFHGFSPVIKGGNAPSWQELCGRHPGLVAEIQSVLTGQSRIHNRIP